MSRLALTLASVLLSAPTARAQCWSEAEELAPPIPADYDAVALCGDTLVLGLSELVALASGRDAVFRYERAPLTTYCTAGLSASGCEALISATGTPSASAPTGFTLRANGV